LLWVAVGTGLRLTHLALKSPWTDEFATLVFSLGHSFQTVPLDQPIALDTLLQPLQPTSAGAKAVIHHLLSEDNHPPLYFVLAHWWMQLFPLENGFVPLWAARSLPALFGAASIPLMFGLGWLTFRSRLVGHLAAAMMAVSPYGVYLAQESRHYTLGILWVIASLACLMVVIRSIRQRSPFPFWVGLLWVVINSLGFATHFFFALTLCAEALVVMGLGWQQFRREKTNPFLQPYGWRIGAVAMGTLGGILVWLPILLNIPSNETTQWIQTHSVGWLTVINPIAQMLASWITMLVLLPIESPDLTVVTLSGLVMLAFLLWALPILWRGFKRLWEQSESHLPTQVLSGFVVGAIALFFLIAYGLGSDITRGARYNFVYFPAVIALLGAILAAAWSGLVPIPKPKRLSFSGGPASPQNRRWPWLRPLTINGKQAVVVILLMGLLSGLTVVNNLGYQKYYRPDLLLPIIQARSDSPVLIATTHETLVQTGEMMGVAWEFKHHLNAAEENSDKPPKFLLAHRNRNPQAATMALQNTLAQLPRPLDLWLLNFHAPVESATNRCVVDSRSQPAVDGYEYQHYHCPARN
jgi:uncharacterized membrane protein